MIGGQFSKLHDWTVYNRVMLIMPLPFAVNMVHLDGVIGILPLVDSLKVV